MMPLAESTVASQSGIVHVTPAVPGMKPTKPTPPISVSTKDKRSYKRPDMIRILNLARHFGKRVAGMS